jgi:hypothetical protein
VGSAAVVARGAAYIVTGMEVGKSSTLDGPTAGYGLACGSQILDVSSRENDNEDRERSTNCSLELKMELGNAT